MQDQALGRQSLLDMAGNFREACVIGAAAELDLFNLLGSNWRDLDETSRELQVDRRGLAMLLDALAALGLIEKVAGRYRVAGDLLPWLTDGPQTVLPMVRHSMSILRSWQQLAAVVKTGQPAERIASIRGAEADRAAFIAAMHTVSGPVADALVATLGRPPVRHLLDIGGASGTWTLAFLRAMPSAVATLFDLPDAIQQARARLAGDPIGQQVSLVAGDFYRDELPAGADYAWVSAIIHQHSREETRDLFAKVFRALTPGGRIGIRDVVMAPDRTRPVFGALFAINMLVNTQAGGTFTFEEIAEDLLSVGFTEPRLAVDAPDMSAVVEAVKPAK